MPNSVGTVTCRRGANRDTDSDSEIADMFDPGRSLLSARALYPPPY